ncbi:MAG: carbon storage regulator [Steroidobacteraceae bacterium]
MLILTRRPGEALLIGDSIEFNILAIHHHLVRIETITDAAVLVQRGEVPHFDLDTDAMDGLLITEDGHTRRSSLFTRSAQQSLRIGEEIEVQVLDVKGQQTRLGVQAPRGVVILRCNLSPLARRELQRRESEYQTLPLHGLRAPDMF